MIPVPFKLVGQTGGHKATRFSAELSQNIYLEVSESSSRVGMIDFPGLKAFGSQAGADRGAHVMSGNLYRICGSSLYRVNSAGAHTLIGAIGGSSRAVFADDGTNMMIVTSGVAYLYNGSGISGSAAPVSNASSVAYINQQFLVSGGDEIAVSNVGDPTTWNTLNVAEEETAPDAILRLYVFSQLVYVMGEQTIVPWYNTGAGNPPFARQDTSLVNVGIAGSNAVTNTDQYIYWLGDDRKVYRGVGASYQPVSTSAISIEIESFAVVSDCVASSFTLDGQDFVVFHFPTANRTFFYQEKYEFWGVLSSGVDFNRWVGSQVIPCYGKALVATDDAVLELDTETYTDNGAVRLRVRTLPSFTSNLINVPGRRVTVGRVRINVETGVGLITGQGSNPVLMCELSSDGGKTWGPEIFVEIGQSGQYQIPVDFDAFETGYEVRCRIKCTDPVFLAMYEGIVYLADGGY